VGGAACRLWDVTSCWPQLDKDLGQPTHQPHICCMTNDSRAHRLLSSLWAVLQVMDALMADPRLGRNLTAPSISAGRNNLYMRGDCPDFAHLDLHPACLRGTGWSCSVSCLPEAPALQSQASGRCIPGVGSHMQLESTAVSKLT
jgi:hypothetical protein